MHAISVAIIGVAWLAAWRAGARWVRGCGVDSRASALTLGSIVPTAGLIFTVHLTALVSLVTAWGLVTPESVAIVFVLLTLALARLVRRTRIPTGGAMALSSDSASSSLHPYLYLPLLVIAGLYSLFLLDAMTRYPTGYDGLSYHLPVTLRWARERTMNLVFGSLGDSYPENGMIVPFLMVFAKLEWLLPLAHLAKALLLAGSIWGLSQAMGAARAASIAGVCISLSVPIVVFQSFSGYVDLYGAASWLCAMLALTWAAKTPVRCHRRRLLFLAGLSAGVALGSKITFLVLVPMAALAAIAVAWIRPIADDRDRRQPLRNLAIFTMAVLVCSGFWFVRGTVQAGNPFYPLAIEIGDERILPGITGEALGDRMPHEKLSHWWDYPWQESKYGEGYTYGVDNGLGGAYATFVPIAVLGLLLTRRTYRPRSPAEKWRLLSLFMVVIGGVLLVTAFREILRFVLPLVLLAIALAAAHMSPLCVRFPRAVPALLTAALLPTAAIAGLRPAHSFLGRLRDGDWSRAWFYQIPPALDDLPPGACILNLADAALTYPLAGDDLEKIVIPPHAWQPLLRGQPMSAQELRDNGVGYIFVRPPWPADWPTDLPVEKIYDDTDSRPLMTTPATRIYRVLNRDETPAKSLAQIPGG